MADLADDHPAPSAAASAPDSAPAATASAVYTDEEINHILRRHNENLNALSTFEIQETQKKKVLITNLRDTVCKLVEVGKIAIHDSQIANYVYNELHKRNITYTKGHFYDLFPDNLKGKYAKSSLGNSLSHEHDWQPVSKSKNGDIWQQCSTCGANQINGMELAPAANDQKGQQNEEEEEEEEQEPHVTELIIPTGKSFEIIDQFIAISQNNIRCLKLIKKKCTVHKSSIKKQAAKCIDVTEEDRLRDAKKQASICISTVERQMAATAAGQGRSFPELLNHTNRLIAAQRHAIRQLNFRTSISLYEKIMAKFAVCIGYDQNDIADFLSITSKHMKLNVLQEGNNRKSVLMDLQWFGRCPNPDCGIMLKDYCEDRIDQWQQGTPITDAEDFELEPLQQTGYQKQVIDLQQKLKSMQNALR